MNRRAFHAIRPAGLALAAMALVGLCACQGGLTPAKPKRPMIVERETYAATFDAAVHELRRAGFTVQRQDYRMGVIDTAPLDVASALEPWRAHQMRGTLGLQGTLNHLRRQANVRLVPVEERADSAYRLDVEVQLYRHQAVNRRITGTAGREIFSELDQTPAEQRRRGIDGSYWEPIGRDAKLERRLSARIARRAGDGS